MILGLKSLKSKKKKKFVYSCVIWVIYNALNTHKYSEQNEQIFSSCYSISICLCQCTSFLLVCCSNRHFLNFTLLRQPIINTFVNSLAIFCYSHCLHNFRSSYISILNAFYSSNANCYCLQHTYNLLISEELQWTNSSLMFRCLSIYEGKLVRPMFSNGFKRIEMWLFVCACICIKHIRKHISHMLMRIIIFIFMFMFKFMFAFKCNGLILWNYLHAFVLEGRQRH